MLRHRVPPELCVSCAVVEVRRRLDLSPRGPRVPAHLESLPFTRAPDSCVVLWEDVQDSLGVQDPGPPALPSSCCSTLCRNSQGTREREDCAFNGCQGVINVTQLQGRRGGIPSVCSEAGTPGGGVEVTAPVTGVPMAQPPPPREPSPCGVRLLLSRAKAHSVCSVPG